MLPLSTLKEVGLIQSGPIYLRGQSGLSCLRLKTRSGYPELIQEGAQVTGGGQIQRQMGLRLATRAELI